MNITSLSNEFTVKQLTEDDIEAIYTLCAGNPLYYEYCPPAVSKERIQSELTELPPHTDASCKHFVGFYEGQSLIAVMDLIDGYPDSDIAYIGFFMTDASTQNKGLGSRIIESTCSYLASAGFSSVQLAWMKGNPQSEHFWLKNKFTTIKETSSNVAESVLLAERKF